MKNRQKRVEITQDMVLAELAAVAFANGTDFVTVTQTGSVRITPTGVLPAEKKKAIAAIKEGQYGTEVKLYDKVRALELLGKHLGVFKGRDIAEEPTADDGLLDAFQASAAAAFSDGDDSDTLPEKRP